MVQDENIVEKMVESELLVIYLEIHNAMVDEVDHETAEVDNIDDEIDDELLLTDEMLPHIEADEEVDECIIHDLEDDVNEYLLLGILQLVITI